MKKLYLDAASNGCTAVYVKDAEVVPAGTTISSMPVKMKNREYQKYAEEYDICFIFDDHIPALPFYTVPWVDLMATDSRGGYIGTIGAGCDLESDAPICYIDRNRNCYLLAANGAEFLKRAPDWRSRLERYEGIVFYNTRDDAEKELTFIPASNEPSGHACMSI